jgi:hypothetical protein
MTDTDNLANMTYAQLTDHAGRGQEAHQKVSVEVARRLCAAVDDFSTTAKRQTWAMIWLSVVIAILTAALVWLGLDPH